MKFHIVTKYFSYLVILLVFITSLNFLAACTSSSTSSPLTTIRPTTIWKGADYTGWFINNLEVKPNTVTIGQDAEVSAWINAPGMVLTQITTILSVDGERKSTKTIYVEGDSTHFISFIFNPDVAGKHKISFGAILTRDLDYYILGEKDLSKTLIVTE